MNGGAIIAEILYQHGVRHLFTLCGGHISPIFVEAERKGIRVIDTRHEATAVFAADAVGRLTGIPGIAAVTAGPGLTNSLTALQNALLAQSPLILLTGATATLLKGRGALQDIDQVAAIKAHIKWYSSLKKVKDIIPTLNEAFYQALSGVSGPVMIECPIDLLYPETIVKDWYSGKGQGKPSSLLAKARQWYISRHAKGLFEGTHKRDWQEGKKPPLIPSHTQKQLKKARNLLGKTKRPLLILGSGAMMQPHKVDQLAEAIGRLGIPVYTSGMARGLLPRDSPLLFRHKRRDAIKASDLLLLAGVSNDFRFDYGRQIGRKNSIAINRSKKDLFLNHTPRLPVLADPCDFLLELSKEPQATPQEWLDDLRERERARQKEIDHQASQPCVGINPLKLLQQFESLLGKEAVLVADGGDFVGTASYILNPRGPLVWLDPGAFGTLGVGAGFAIGAAMVYPDRPIWIIYGDGSAGYSLMEFDTFKRHRLPIGAIIGNDACWAQIARDQVELLGSDCAVNLAPSDYQEIPKAFGADGEKLDHIEHLEKTMEKAQKALLNHAPFLINAKIGKTDFRKGSISV
jgi:thiamine pyrophosphate-dependent acetolactate synthase large subunit-like protein